MQTAQSLSDDHPKRASCPFSCNGFFFESDGKVVTICMELISGAFRALNYIVLWSARTKEFYKRTDMATLHSNQTSLASRLQEAIGDESGASFARRCGISEGAIRKYFHGASPSTENLVAIAEAANVSIEWLATGRGPKQRGIAPVVAVGENQPPVAFTDTQRLARAIRAVQEGLASIKRTLPPEKHAQLIEAAYELICEEEGNTAKVVRLIKLAA